MLRTQIAAVIGCARGNALDEIMREVWTRYGAGQLTDDEAGELTTLAHERRAALRGSGQTALGPIDIHRIQIMMAARWINPVK